MSTARLPDLSGIPDIIGIHLYGGKSIFKNVRDTKVTAKVMCCDRKDCSLRRNGKCLRVPSLSVWGESCQYGRRIDYEGYTPKAGIYTEWCNVFKKHKMYAKVNAVKTECFAVMGDYYMIDTRYVCFSCGKFETASSYGSILTRFFIKKSEVDTDFITGMLKFVPYTLFDHKPITEYQKDIVPLIMKDMKELAPELYEKIISAAPELSEKKIDYIGKSVYVKTLKGGIDINIEHHGIFHLSVDKKTLTCKEYTSSLLPCNAKTATLIIPVTDDMTYTVKSNDEICSDTELVK